LAMNELPLPRRPCPMPIEPPLSWPDMDSKRSISNRPMQDRDSLSISFTDLRRRVHHPDIAVGNNNIFCAHPCRHWRRDRNVATHIATVLLPMRYLSYHSTPPSACTGASCAEVHVCGLVIQELTTSHLGWLNMAARRCMRIAAKDRRLHSHLKPIRTKTLCRMSASIFPAAAARPEARAFARIQLLSVSRGKACGRQTNYTGVRLRTKGASACG
jgi:hypothetical protein